MVTTIVEREFCFYCRLEGKIHKFCEEENIRYNLTGKIFDKFNCTSDLVLVNRKLKTIIDRQRVLLRKKGSTDETLIMAGYVDQYHEEFCEEL